MKVCYQALIAKLMTVVYVLLLLSCASPQSRPPVADIKDVQKEAVTQQSLAAEIAQVSSRSKPPAENVPETQGDARKRRAAKIRSMVDSQLKLSNVAYTIITEATNFCGRKRLVSCFLVVHKGMARAELQQQTINDAFGIKDLPKIAGVFQNSPCEKAGLQLGDEIVSINGTSTPHTDEKINGFLTSLESRTPLEIDILRDGLPIHFSVEQSVACDYPVWLVNDNGINAHADGQRIYVTAGLVRFVDSDTELAAVVSHEMAHNVRGHTTIKNKNSTVAGAGGLVLDIASAIVGIDTQGAFSRAGFRKGLSSYSKEMEREADYVGQYILAQAGYDPKTAPNIFRRLGALSPENIEGQYMASHPSSPERYVILQKAAEEIARKKASGLPLKPEERK
jgi:hypothetical protein